MDIKFHARIRDGGIVCTSPAGLDVAARHSARQPFPIVVLDLTTPDGTQPDELARLVNVTHVHHRSPSFLR